MLLAMLAHTDPVQIKAAWTTGLVISAIAGYYLSVSVGF